ncbi:hypothetical protein ACFUIY_09605 [Streptomyces griseorubiginosus]|nr:hypothetical protein [Streptomyces griseorubiginosus]
MYVDQLAEAAEQRCYRAMDWLHEMAGDLEKQVFNVEPGRVRAAVTPQ